MEEKDYDDFEFNTLRSSSIQSNRRVRNPKKCLLICIILSALITVVVTSFGWITYLYVHDEQSTNTKCNYDVPHHSIDLLEGVATTLKSMNSASVGVSLGVSISDIRGHRSTLHDLGDQLFQGKVSSTKHKALCDACQKFMWIRGKTEGSLEEISDPAWKIQTLFNSTCIGLLCPVKLPVSQLSTLHAYFSDGDVVENFVGNLLNDSTGWLTSRMETCNLDDMVRRIRFTQWLGLAGLMASEINSGYASTIYETLLSKRKVSPYNNWIEMTQRMSRAMDQCKMLTSLQTTIASKAKLTQNLHRCQSGRKTDAETLFNLNKTVEDQLINQEILRQQLTGLKRSNQMANKKVTTLNMKIGEMSKFEAALNQSIDKCKTSLKEETKRSSKLKQTLQQQIQKEIATNNALEVCKLATQRGVKTVANLKKMLYQEMESQVGLNTQLDSCKATKKTDNSNIANLNAKVGTLTQAKATLEKDAEKCRTVSAKNAECQVTVQRLRHNAAGSHRCGVSVVFMASLVSVFMYAHGVI